MNEDYIYIVLQDRKEDVYLHGRFGNFEYWNMDKVLRESKNLSERIKLC